MKNLFSFCATIAVVGTLAFAGCTSETAEVTTPTNAETPAAGEMVTVSLKLPGMT